MEIDCLDVAMEHVRNGALVVVNHSGGKDSQAQMIMLAKHVPVEQLLVVHASLGDVEWPGALEHAQEQAAALGAAFVVARARRGLLQMVTDRREARPDVPSWPSSSQRQCTSDLKRNPIRREVRAYAKERGFTVILNAMGLRAEESPDRKKKAPWSRNDEMTMPETSRVKRVWYDWLPIHSATTRQVFACIAEAGQKPHPAYALGNERLSCVFCIMASAGDIRNGALRNPELYQRYVALEKQTGYTMHMSRKSLPQITGIE